MKKKSRFTDWKSKIYINKFNGAFKLLESDSKNVDAIKLVYITNIINLLSSAVGSTHQYEQVYDYSTLSDADQNKLS